MDEMITKAIEVIQAGGVVVYPTDTAYALGCAYDNEEAIQRIKDLKGRTDDKFTLIASSGYEAEKHFNFTSIERRLAKHYWPGPLSIVVSERFSIRVPDSKIAKAIAEGVGKPIIATSCNVTGQDTVYDLSTRKGNPDFDALLRQVEAEGVVVDAGELPHSLTSTVVEIPTEIGREQCIIHRAGAIDIAEELLKHQ